MNLSYNRSTKLYYTDNNVPDNIPNSLVSKICSYGLSLLRKRAN